MWHAAYKAERLNNKGIGVFDSGIGGLTVVKELMNYLPHEKIFYLGDTARTPYGTKAKETIIRFSSEIIAFLMKKNVKIIVIACNTASALALEAVRKKFRMDIIGVVDAGAKAAVSATENNRVAVIGTASTIRSGAYEKTIKKYSPRVKVFSKAAPLLVPLVEEGWLNRKETAAILKVYLKDFKKRGVDTLVLGCTHYPLLKPLIKKTMPGVHVIDSAKVVAAQVNNLLQEKNIRATKNNKTSTAFFATDDPARFNRVGRMFLKSRMKTAKLAVL